MRPHLNRATMLMQLGRHEAAEPELRRALAEAPNDALAHALLATCLVEREQFAEATDEAQAALGLAPDEPFVHFTLARVWEKRGYRERALEAIDEALRLAPDDADYHGFRAALHLDASRWREALDAAETGLTFDAEHVACNNYRAMALVKLGRRSEAGATIDAALARDPDDSFSHANKGWTLLEARRTNEALHHFREALRIDPTNEYARVGIVEALKSRNPLYAIFLRYMLWMAKLPPRAQWGVIIGGYFGYRFVGGLAAAHPDWAPFLVPLIVAYVAFAIFTWLARPIFNLLLRFHPFGKHALSDEQASESNWIAGYLATAAVLFGLSYRGGWWLLLKDTAVQAALLTLPLHVVFVCSPGRPRRIMIAAVAGLSAAACGRPAAVYLEKYDLAGDLDGAFWLGWVASIWGGQALAMVRRKR